MVVAKGTSSHCRIVTLTMTTPSMLADQVVICMMQLFSPCCTSHVPLNDLSLKFSLFRTQHLSLGKAFMHTDIINCTQ